MKRQPLLIVLSSPSGGGKSTICEHLLGQDSCLRRSISATTRPLRGNEKAGKDYYFLSDAEFRQKIKQGQFLEWAQVHKHRYGTLKKEIQRFHRQGQDVILVIDVQGGLAVKRRYTQAILIFIEPPSFSALKIRLLQRGTESRQIIQERLKQARWEMAQAHYYDYIIKNSDLPTAVQQVQAIITAERLRVAHQLRPEGLKGSKH